MQERGCRVGTAPAGHEKEVVEQNVAFQQRFSPKFLSLGGCGLVRRLQGFVVMASAVMHLFYQRVLVFWRLFLALCMLREV